MSEVYNFKPLNEVESQAEPSDTTTLLAVDNGTVKQIPASAVGGSGGSFIVETKFDGGMQITSADKTYAEILEASQHGCVPFIRCSADESTGDDGAFFAPLVIASPTEGMLMFCAFVAEGLIAAVCAADDTWVLQMTSL